MCITSVSCFHMWQFASSTFLFSGKFIYSIAGCRCVVKICCFVDWEDARERTYWKIFHRLTFVFTFCIKSFAIEFPSKFVNSHFNFCSTFQCSFEYLSLLFADADFFFFFHFFCHFFLRFSFNSTIAARFIWTISLIKLVLNCSLRLIIFPFSFAESTNENLPGKRTILELLSLNFYLCEIKPKKEW